MLSMLVYRKVLPFVFEGILRNSFLKSTRFCGTASQIPFGSFGLPIFGETISGGFLRAVKSQDEEFFGVFFSDADRNNNAISPIT